MKRKILLSCLAALLLTAALAATAATAAEPPFTGLPTASLLCGANLLSASSIGGTLPAPIPLSPTVCGSCSGPCTGKTDGASCVEGIRAGGCFVVGTCPVTGTWFCACTKVGQ
ncbi:MAG TPA: hypothetical protein VKY89_22450 [Thermoanaerobaculia bacterium]|jgi:hypothetical protein|nr:hypothetical protein [Thermoanaerobaculia bacterium]